MPKAFAIHTVHIGREPGKISELTGKVTQAAVVDEYKPGHIFECEQKHFDELKALGAVREATAIDEAVADTAGYVDPAKLREAAAAARAAAPSPSASTGKTAGDGKAAGDNLLG
jgi:hypothetical protein